MIRLPAEVQTRLADAQLEPYLETILDECHAHGYLLHPTAILGSGTFGTVFLAEREGETIAMKVSVPLPGLEGSFVTMCEEEGRKACALAHIPQVVAGRAYWLASAAPLFFLATRYIHGMNLSTYLERTPGVLAEARLRKWALQLAQGLEAVHQAGVVHRDLKPENLLLEVASDNLYIADLGIAKYARSGTLLDLRRTGTHPYAPREQVRGRTSPKSDQYALGIVLFELATRTAAAPSVPAPRFGYPAARPALLAPRRHNAALSAPFAAVIERLAALDPAGRFPSMQRAYEALLAPGAREEPPLPQVSASGGAGVALTLWPTAKLSAAQGAAPPTELPHHRFRASAPGRAALRARAPFTWHPLFHLLRVLLGGPIALGGPALSRAGTLCLMALYYGWIVAAGLCAGLVGWAISGDSGLIDWALAAAGMLAWWFVVRTWNIGIVRRRGNLSARSRGWLFLPCGGLVALAAGMVLWSLLTRSTQIISPAWQASICSCVAWLGLYGCIEVWLN